MGGRVGDGSIDAGTGIYRPFEESWHARALALTLAAGTLGKWNLDASRHARERLSPADYMRSTYFEKWLCALANLLVEQGVVTESELAAPERIEVQNVCKRALEPRNVENALRKGASTLRKTGSIPLHSIGDPVRTRKWADNSLVPKGHTRLPTYARDRRGIVVETHGAHVLPDSNGHFLGEAPEQLYSVKFTAQELWGPAAESPGDEVVLDLWESYLSPA